MFLIFSFQKHLSGTTCPLTLSSTLTLATPIPKQLWKQQDGDPILSPLEEAFFRETPSALSSSLMVFNPILQDLKLEEERIDFKVGDTHHVTLPYADDFCLLTTNLRTHQKMINRINSNITSMEMKLKPSKCRGFSVCSGRASDILSTLVTM